MLSYDWLRRDKRSAPPGPGPVERVEGVSMLIPRSIMTGVLPAAPEPIMNLDTGKNVRRKNLKMEVFEKVIINYAAHS